MTKMELERLTSFPYRYFQYGSENSTDLDVIIQVSMEEMPKSREDRKKKIRAILDKYELNWNATLAVFEDGVMVDTIHNKAWIDSLNNALFRTYVLHKQLHPCPVDRYVERNHVLAIYKAVRTILTMLTRTKVRSKIKPILKWIHPFELKLRVLEEVDFGQFETFNQRNTSDEDIWKIIAFYIGQNYALVMDGTEVYTKNELIMINSDLKVFLSRERILDFDKKKLNELKNRWIEELRRLHEFWQDGFCLKSSDEVANIKDETC